MSLEVQGVVTSRQELAEGQFRAVLAALVRADVAGQQPAGGAVKAADLAEHPEVTGPAAGQARDQPAEAALPGVLQAAAGAADRHAHLGDLGAHAQLVEQPGEQGICARVVHDEPGVHGQFAPVGGGDLVCVSVPAETLLRLEEGDVGRPGEDVGGRQAGHPAADDGDPPAGAVAGQASGPP